MTPPRLTIRKALPGEDRLLAELATRTFVAAYGADNTPEDLALHLERTSGPAYFQRALANPGTTLLLAEVDGRPAGYVELAEADTPPSVPAGARQLSRFYLEPAWFGRGVSAALMAAAVEDALARSATALWLTVWERAPRPIAFYRKHGFREVGETTFRIGEDLQRDWVMVRGLAPGG